MSRPRRNMAMAQAPRPWRRQVERNIFYRRCGRWCAAHDDAQSEYERAQWRAFFGWPPPMDTARLSAIFAATYAGRISDISGGTANNPLLRLLR